jgi:hypothetical protein
MFNTIETTGLRVETITPELQKINVDVHSEIDITFNSDIDTGTIVGNFIVLEDPDLLFTSISSIDKTRFITVQGNVTYEDRTIKFKPTNPFKENTKILVLLRAKGITDIMQRSLVTDFVGIFYTECDATLPKCEFITPKFGVITPDVPEFSWVDQESEAYVFQVSHDETFEILLCDKVIKNETSTYAKTSYTPNLILDEGLYYARVKSIYGHWSDPLQLFIKRTTEAVVSREDINESLILEELDAAFVPPLEILEMFPSNDTVNINPKINIIYMKVAGQVNSTDIDFSNTFVEGSLFDDEDADTAEPHGYLDGEWTVIYDSLKDVTYIVFSPIALGGV